MKNKLDLNIIINATNDCRVVLYEAVEINGQYLILMLCSHAGGYLLSIPDLKLCIGVIDNESVNYQRLVESGMDKRTAEIIAGHISEYIVF